MRDKVTERPDDRISNWRLIHGVGPRGHIDSMFGMSDPSQVIQQFRRYAAEGRLEIAEVMASELTEQLLLNKKRDLATQQLLVDALRDLANIYEMRKKFKLSLTSSKVLRKQRNTLRKMYLSNNDRSVADEVSSYIADDEIQVARTCIALKKLGAARSHLKSADKARPFDLVAAVTAVRAEFAVRTHMRKAKNAVKKLLECLDKAGSVNHQAGSFQLLPTNQKPVDVVELITDIEKWISPDSGLNDGQRSQLQAYAEGMKQQMVAIESGEQAANAALAAAVDKLNPVVDYHAYSRGS